MVLQLMKDILWVQKKLWVQTHDQGKLEKTLITASYKGFFE